MFIKDLPEEQRKDLKGLKVKTSKGVVGYVNQCGHCVVLLTSEESVNMIDEAKRDENRLYPQIIEKDEDILEWEVIENDDIKCNCHLLTSHKNIINFQLTEEA